MKLYIPLMALAVLSLGSCSTAYRTGQTPDDVYFSPSRDKDEYVVVDKEDDRSYRGEDYYEDRYLRNRIRDRYRYSALDDYYNNPYAYNSYGYSGVGYGLSVGYGSLYSPWNSYYIWNNYCNPYYSGYGYGGYGGYGGVIKVNGNYTPPSRTAAFNPRSYGVPANNVRSQSYRPGYNPTNSANAPRYNNSNNSRNNSGTLGSSVRRVFSSNGSSNENNSRSNSNNSTPSRTYNPPSSSSSSSSGSSSRSSGGSSGGGGGSRPIR